MSSSALTHRWWNLQPCSPVLMHYSLSQEDHTCLHCAVVRHVWCQRASSFTYGGFRRGAETSQSVLSASAGKTNPSSSRHQASYHVWNATPTPIVLRKPHRKGTMRCIAASVCVLKCMHMCDRSQFCVLYIFCDVFSQSCSHNNSRVHFNQFSTAYWRELGMHLYYYQYWCLGFGYWPMPNTSPIPN